MILFLFSFAIAIQRLFGKIENKTNHAETDWGIIRRNLKKRWL